jgi:hypothetical protein
MDATTREILIGRVVGRDDDTVDWRRLRTLAVVDDGVWNELAAALEDDAVLRRSGRELAATAERVELPEGARRSVPPVVHWLPWVAVFAALTLWLFERSRPALPPDAPAATAHQVVGELPPVLVSSEPSRDGSQVEVVYLRRILERQLMTDLVAIRRDELGQPFGEPAQPAMFVRRQSF